MEITIQTLLILLALWTVATTSLSFIIRGGEVNLKVARIRFVAGGLLLYLGKGAKASATVYRGKRFVDFLLIASLLIGLVLFYTLFIPQFIEMFRGFLGYVSGARREAPTPVAVPIPLLLTVPSIVKPLILSIAIAVATHEFAHAITALRRGVDVKSWGVGIFLLFPLAFVELNDNAFKALQPRSRAVIASAGPFANAAIALVSWLALQALLLSAAPAVQVLGINCGICSSDPCPAKLAGLSSGDILLAINGTRIWSVNDVGRVLGSARIGDTITLTICRGGICFNRSATLNSYVLNTTRPCLGVSMQNTVVFMRGGIISVNPIAQELAIHMMFIFLVNISLFIFNAIPLYVTDGSIALNALAELIGGAIEKLVRSRALDIANLIIIIIAIIVSTYLFIGA
jgi:membrane-associated protease RseP (regulator of RpoE activity)